MDQERIIEECPTCKSASAVRPKLVLIDEAWDETMGESRLAYFADLRADDIKPEHLNSAPLQHPSMDTGATPAIEHLFPRKFLVNNVGVIGSLSAASIEANTLTIVLGDSMIASLFVTSPSVSSEVTYGYQGLSPWR